jgi:hypothetical protein
LYIDGIHSTKATLLQGFFPIDINGSGPYNITLNDVRLTMLIDFNITNWKYLNLKTLIVTATVGSAQTNFQGFSTELLTNIFNTAASIAMPAQIIAQVVQLNIWIVDQFIPIVNILLNQVSIIDAASFLVNYLEDNARNIINAILRGWICN